ncbi:ABC-2 family transporter protein [Candidatus Curtissbacteria bacterium]|nr:ABC-2 family transporter protein [Candidatus Curtissbacteria bacterium]
MVSKIKKHLKIWWVLTVRLTQIAMISRIGALLFISGKLLRFAFFLMFLLILGAKTKVIAGYSIPQIIFTFATFNIVDTSSQLLMREVYRFRSYVVSGEFDHFLTKPTSVLLRCLFGGSDILDLPVLIVSIGFVIYSSLAIGNFTLLSVFLYIALLVNALILAMSMHIIVLAMGVLTTEIDHTIMIYRDITQMGRLPVDIYKQPLSWVITFIIPVGLMMTIPAKSFFTFVSPELIVISIITSAVFLILSLKLWRFALKNYTSISS